ncbi:MAG: class I SAM-dependent methyltransferase [Chloroflexota bacterium]|nr:class I SAM-dependent methyltransferase [Chloroflexota bacterium]
MLQIPGFSAILRAVSIDDKAIRLGHPSYVWRFGQDRRLDLMRRFVRYDGARILDIGCGIGTYVDKFRSLGARAFGVDIDVEKLAEARRAKRLQLLTAAVSETLPFRDNYFDVVVLHEVIEHVADDRQTVREAYRVAHRNGRIIVFAPNRLYPFETHGVFFGKRYVFGNIPLIGWLPDWLRNKFAPHVRAYRARDLRALFTDMDGTLLMHTQIYPGYDKIARRSAALARVFRRVTYFLEATPLRAFGLSHFLVWKKGTRHPTVKNRARSPQRS